MFAPDTASAGWNVTAPDGRHGSGPTPADAVANIGAQLLPDAAGRRWLHRADGTTVALDAAPDGEG